jgi:tetratricopeptide (TPR) repeat protein
MRRMIRVVSILFGAISLFASPAFAQAPGTAAFRSKAQEQKEFISKLRRDIAKVTHSVEVTKELISRSRGAPFLPDIYLRLAELYVEQARYEFYLVHEERGETSKGSAVVPTARLLKEKAVETYQRILAEWPSFKDNDKVLFFLAHELRELGQYEDMIKRYEELVSKYPKSALLLDAYLVLGDYRFDKSDLVGAKRYYQKILDSPDTPVHDLAHFKMGWVYLNEADYKEALGHFEAAVGSANDPDAITSRREQQRLVNVKREALIDLVYAYTEERKPKSALPYFRKLARSRNAYLLALQKLANRYFVKSNFNAAAMVYREITRLSGDAELNLDFTNRIYEATKNSQNYNFVNLDVEAMLRAVDGYRFDWRIPKAQRDAAEHDFEVFARDLSTKAQAKAIEKKDSELSQRVAKAYTRYLESFPNNDHRRDIVENLADTLFEAKLFIRAGDRYEEAAELAKQDDKAKEEALYNACASFYESLKNSQKLPRFQRVWAQEGLARNGIRYVETFPRSPKVPEIKLNIGRSYFESGDYDKAIGIFNEFIASYSTDQRAMTVADLILDAYNQKQDYAQLAERARQLASIPGLGDQAFKDRMITTAKRAEERQIGEVILTASVETKASDDAGQTLRKYWESNKNSPVAEKTLYTAFVQYKEARDFDKTFETGNQFIGAYPKSQYLGDVFGTLASFTTQTGEYDQAAVYLEEYYKRFPSDSSAQKMLAQAATIKQLANDHRGAISDYGELLKTVSDHDSRAKFATHMLESYEALDDWSGVQEAAQKVLKTDARNIRANLMLGLALEKAGDLDGALKSFQNAVNSAGRSSDDTAQDDAARAAFSIGDVIYRQFSRVQLDGDIQAAAQAKAELLGQLEGALVDAVGYNRGEWAVASLHRAALAYKDFADFLEKAPPPEGLSADEVKQYKQLVEEQAAPLKKKSEEFFQTCIDKARELAVFTGAVLGCIAHGSEQPVPAIQIRAAQPTEAKRKELKQRLTKNPKDLDAIAELADFFLASNQPALAKLAASRGLELEEHDARFHNKMGMADLLLSRPQEAYQSFLRAMEMKHPYARANIIALMVSFRNLDGAKKLASKADAEEVPASAPDLHPDASRAIASFRK